MSTGSADSRGRLLHLTDDPGSSALLRQQLGVAELEFDVERIAEPEVFERALHEGRFQLIVADLPLPWSGATEQLQLIQRMHPDWPVVFRWGDPGFASSEHPDQQLATTIRQALRLSPARAQSSEERRLMLAELVLHQQLVLDLTRRATGDTTAVLAEITRRASLQLGVERVSVWDFDATQTRLRCLDMYVRSADRHQTGDVVAGHPRYRRALDAALQIAATDAWTDPRTSEFLGAYLRPQRIRAMLDAPIRLNGAVVGVLCFEHMDTPRVWSLLEQCLATSLASLLGRVFAERDRRRSQEIAQRNERMAAIGRIAATVAHDFANHVHVLAALADSLATGAGPSAAPLSATIRDELGRATTKVRELLAIGSITRSDHEPPPPIDLRAELAALEPMVRAALGPDVQLELLLPPTPLAVRVRPTELQQLLVNFASNARDALAPHTRRGELRVEVARVSPATGAADVARLVVADNGPGLAPEVADRVFEPFVTTKPPMQGSGLGLATVFELVHRRKGTIGVDSSPRGTQFVVDFPLADGG